MFSSGNSQLPFCNSQVPNLLVKIIKTMYLANMKTIPKWEENTVLFDRSYYVFQLYLQHMRSYICLYKCIHESEDVCTISLEREKLLLENFFFTILFTHPSETAQVMNTSTLFADF